MYKVIRSEKIQGQINSLGKSNEKKVELLSGSWDGHYAVATVVIDNTMPPAEVHEKSADVWNVLKGAGKFILGGILVNSKKIRDNELTGDSIDGGDEITVGPGDIIDIPANIPHQIDARNGRLEMIIIKVAVAV